MNEHIDILLTASKLASRNNPWANLATHTVSMAYNVSMLWHYSYQLGMANAVGSGYLAAEQIQTIKRERLKHTVLLALESVGLIVSSIVALQENKR